jgi:hypothetical protein
LVKHVMASVRELRHVLATKHLNAYAMGSNCPTPSLELAGGDSHGFSHGYMGCLEGPLSKLPNLCP